MAAFRYRAVDLAGKEISGTLQAESGKHARAQLRARDLFSIEVQREDVTLSSTGIRRGIRGTALVNLTRQWATLLDSGLTIEETITAIRDQADTNSEKAVLEGVRQQLLAGHALHVALASYPDTFDSLYRALIEAGERSGKLAQVFSRLADVLESGHALRQKLIQSLIYPALIVLVAVAVVGALMIWVVPQVVSVFQGGRQSLPLLTEILILISNFLALTWPVLLLALPGFYFIFGWLMRDESLKRKWHFQLMKLPIAGRLLVSIDTANMAQTMSILIGSGVPILAALEACRRVTRLLPISDALSQAVVHVREGGTLHRGLAGEKVFPPILLHMIHSGEKSGRLPEMLERTARQQQQEVSNRLTLAVSVIEPMLILLMGGVVMFIVIAILQPIIEINQLMR